MILAFSLPSIVEAMTEAEIRAFHAGVGSHLTSGSALCDLTVDLSATAPHDCPPISHYRIAIREPVWLRAFAVRQGEIAAVGAAVALFSTDEHEPLGPPARDIRYMMAGVTLSAEDGLW